MPGILRRMGNANGSLSASGFCITRKEIERMERRFKRLSHGTDRASVAELTSGPELADNPHAARLFDLHDGDRDGMLTWNEFLAAIDAMTKLGNDDARTEFAFRMYDSDGDGYISEAELEAGMRQVMGPGMGDSQLSLIVKHTLAAHDADGDGRLSLPEFRSLVSCSADESSARC